MNILPVLLILLAQAPVEVALAPDQPLPHVYIDDPLIVELKSSVDTPADVKVTIDPAAAGDNVERVLEAVPLRSGSSRWVPLRDLPASRGFYEARFSIELGGEPVEQAARFARIDRLKGNEKLPVYAHGVDPKSQAVLALKSVAVNTIRIDAGTPESQSLIEAARNRGLGVVLYLDPGTVEKPADTARTLARDYCGIIERWEVEPHGNSGILGAIVEAVREGGCTAPVSVVVGSPEDFRALLQSGAGHVVRAAVWRALSPDAAGVETMRGDAAQHGYEHWSIHTLALNREKGSGSGEALTRRFFELSSAGAATMGFDAAVVYDGDLHEPLVYLNGLAHRFMGTEYAGEIPLGRGIRAPIFRDGARWFLALWCDNGAKTIDLDTGNAIDLVLTDAQNNPLALAAEKGKLSRLSLGSTPVYLTGSNGSLLAQAARARAQRLAQRISGAREFQANLPRELLEIVGKSAGPGAGRMPREDYFALLRVFPELERRWHTGALPKPVAVPAMAQLSRLARALATVEQQEGEPFLEPVSDTLARCEEYQSLYLTGSTGTTQAHERGDWLLGEVRRLIDEAETLAAQDRKIEAAAVGALAEWRARCLEFAAQAGPLSDTPVPDTVTAQLLLETVEPAPVPIVPDDEAEDTQFQPEPEPEPVPEVIHTIARGDTLSKIAQTYKVKVADLLEWNNLSKDSTLRIGQEIKVEQPGAAAASATETEAAPDMAPEPAPEPEVQTARAETEDRAATAVKKHTVARGESPSVIASRHKVRLDDLLAWNKLTRRSTLRVGQELVVSDPAGAPQSATAAPAPEPDPEPEEAAPEPAPEEDEDSPAPSAGPARTHKVAKGESPGVIADRYKIKLADLLAWNKLTRRSTLQIGQELIVSEPDGSASAASQKAEEEETKAPAVVADEKLAPGQPKGTKRVMHTVARGDTIDSIARQYGVDAAQWRKWNGIRAGARLAAGKRYVVYMPADKAAPAQAASSEKQGTSGGSAPQGANTITHTVQRGDSPYIIAKKYGVSLDDFLKWNKLNKSSMLQIGQKLVVHVKQ